MTETLTTVPRPSRHIDAVLALDPDTPGPTYSVSFNSLPAHQFPGADWPPSEWD